MKLNHSKLIIISGLVWFAIGSGLLYQGLFLLTEASKTGGLFSNWLQPYFGGLDEAIIALMCGALVIGFFKGRMVLGKSARAGIERIRAMAEPVALTSIYSAKYYILIGTMVLLGMSIKWMGLPNDVRGFVDVAIGSALINGAMFYFRSLGDRKVEANCCNVKAGCCD